MTEPTEQTGGLEDRIERLERENEQLRERLAALAAQVAEGSSARRVDGDGPDDHSTVTGGHDAMSEAVTSGGQPTKAIGRLSDTDGIGVLGEATGGGTTRGVEGVTQSSSDGAAAVNAEAQGSSGNTYGVRARTQSDQYYAAAVDAKAPNGRSDAVRADTQGSRGNALFATADADAWHPLRAEHYANSGSEAQAIDASTGSPDAAAIRATGNGGGAFKAQGTIIVNDSSEQRTAGPIAKGFINSDGSIANAVNVNSVSRIGTNNNGYRIDIADVSYTKKDYVTIVTPSAEYLTDVGSIGGGEDLSVYLRDTSLNNQSGDFQFVVYELPNGSVTTSSTTTSSTTEDLSDTDDRP